jgi:Flp pilus assembly protein TadG
MRTTEDDTRDRGAAVLEFVLVVPIVLTLLVGLIDFGRAYSMQVQMHGAAREGARTLSLGRSTSEAAAAARAAAPGMTITTVSTTACAGSGSTATVTVGATYTFSIPFVPIGARNLSATAAMRCQ